MIILFPILILSVFAIQESNAQYFQTEINSDIFPNSLKFTLEDNLKTKFFQNPTIANDSIKTRTAGGSNEDHSITWYIRIIYDVANNEKIHHMDSIYKLGFNSMAEPPENTIFEKVFEMHYKPPKKIKNSLSSEENRYIHLIIQNIMCRQGFEKIFKLSDDSPVCVKSSTAEKLIDRGWKKQLDEHISIQTKNQISEIIDIKDDFNNSYSIPYTITNGTLIDLRYEVGEFYGQISTDGDGTIEFTVPRLLIDPSDYFGELDKSHYGELISDEKLDCDSRKIMIRFDSGDPRYSLGFGGFGVQTTYNSHDKFDIIVDEKPFVIETSVVAGSVCNLDFSKEKKSISYPIRAPIGSKVNALVYVPDELLWDNFTVFADDISKAYQTEQYENITKVWFDMKITKKIHNVEIVGTNTIPLIP